MSCVWRLRECAQHFLVVAGSSDTEKVISPTQPDIRHIHYYYLRDQMGTSRNACGSFWKLAGLHSYLLCERQTTTGMSCANWEQWLFFQFSTNSNQLQCSREWWSIYIHEYGWHMQNMDELFIHLRMCTFVQKCWYHPNWITYFGNFSSLKKWIIDPKMYLMTTKTMNIYSTNLNWVKPSSCTSLRELIFHSANYKGPNWNRKNAMNHSKKNFRLVFNIESLSSNCLISTVIMKQ